MFYRAFRHIESGRWLGTLMATGAEWTTEPEAAYELDFRTPPEQHLADVLAAYQSQGWKDGEVEVVESSSDPRTGDLIDPDPVPVDPAAERLDALHALLAAQDLTGPQTSEMLRLERGLEPKAEEFEL